MAINPTTLSNVPVHVLHPRRVRHNSHNSIKQILPKTLPTIQGSDLAETLLMVDLVAKMTTSKVSAQWSNDETVHQILVELLNGESVDTSELLRKVGPIF